MKRTLFLVMVAGFFAASSATAQKNTQDIRPLHGLDRSQFETFSSVDAYLAAQALAGTPRVDIRTAATVVGRVNVESLGTRQLTSVAQMAPQKAPQTGQSTVGRLMRAENGTVRWMEGALGKVSVSAFGKRSDAEVSQSLRQILVDRPSLLGLQNPASELATTSVVRDELGFVHARFHQTWDGVPVWGGDVVVHADANGNVYAVNGAYQPSPSGVDTSPTLTSDRALAATIRDLQRRDEWDPIPDDVAAWLDIEGPNTEMAIYPDDEAGPRLAYLVSLHPNFVASYTYIIDAEDGRVLNRIARHCTIWHNPEGDPKVSIDSVDDLIKTSKNASAGTFFDATANDLNGQSQSLRVYQHDDNTFYNVWDLPNIDLGKSQLPNTPSGGALTLTASGADLNENTNLAHVVSNNNTWSDPTSVSAHVNMKTAYEYFKNVHGRNAIDGKDQSIISVIHVTDKSQPMDNAFWNGRVMAYGDGAQSFKPLAGSLDVAGHEMTHGVIQSTAGLVYQFQSGALNESFADVFGYMIEPADFLLGEDVMNTNAIALRDMLNPDNPQVLSPQPAHMNAYRNLTAEQDNGGVHVNSGIPNRAAALIVQSIGQEPTGRIYYRALSNYMTRNSEFVDARNAVEQSAVDLFGNGSTEHLAVQQGFDSVGIVGGTGGGGGDGGNDVPSQTGGNSLIAFMLDDGTVGYIDLTDIQNIQTLTFNDPGAVALVSNEGGFRSQLTTTLTGEDIWFVNSAGQLAFITVSDGSVSVFESLSLQQAGDLWNASISPDGNFVAIVSAYANDPTIYFYDGTDVNAVDLKPETSQEGVFDETIQYPDVVSWSPNTQVPRIAFDAFSEVALGTGGTLNYWSIYEIDFSVGSIYGLIPSQQDGVSTGNITYSNTDPDIVAMNVIDESGIWDVLIGDFSEGSLTSLDLPSFQVEGSNVLDAERPTFSPDDSEIVVTSPSTNRVLFYNPSAQNPITFLEYTVPLFNPHWFVRAGSGGTSNQAPTASFALSGSTGTVPFQVSIDGSGSSDTNNDALSYRWEFGDGTIGSGVTTGHTYSTAGTYSLKLIVTDSGGLSGNTSKQVTVSSNTGTPVEEEEGVSVSFDLRPNHPNPFSSVTTISFDMPDAEEITLEVVDLLGRTVATLAEGRWPAGQHQVRYDGSALPSGIYLARFRSDTKVRTRQIVVVK